MGVETKMRALVRAGDPDAFGQLYEQHVRAVYNHAFWITADWSVAEELTAMTFLEAWRQHDRIELEGGSLRPWLLGIATNTARNITRSARRRRAAMSRLPQGEAVAPDIADEAVSRLDDAERLSAVHAVLAKLRRTEREVLALCVWSGLDYAAAAEALGIPVGTVRSRLSRARTKLLKLAGEELHRVLREPMSGRGQVEAGRVPAARSNQEETR
jgi:RNA polymerase sigma-70 factor (ECF subfamily)